MKSYTVELLLNIDAEDEGELASIMNEVIGKLPDDVRYVDDEIVAEYDIEDDA